MSKLFDTALLMAHDGKIQRGLIAGFGDDGTVKVQTPGQPVTLTCLLLQTAASSPSLCEGDEVLVWRDGTANGTTGVVMGRIGLHGDSGAVSAPEEFARRPKRLVLEAQEEIILRNGRARIRLDAEGNVEILGETFSSRCRRLVRLLAPMIKLN